MAVGCPAAWILASTGRSGITPASGPSSPANRAPRPTPISSATRTSSATPPSGAGPEHATALARAPVRSSPAVTTPVTSQPRGSGQGSQTGTPEPTAAARSTSGVGWTTGCTGGTAPCSWHDQALDQSPGGCRFDPHRGQLGCALIGPSWHMTVPPSRRCVNPRQGRRLLDDAAGRGRLLHDALLDDPVGHRLLDDAAADRRAALDDGGAA